MFCFSVISVSFERPGWLLMTRTGFGDILIDYSNLFSSALRWESERLLQDLGGLLGRAVNLALWNVWNSLFHDHILENVDPFCLVV